MRTDLQLEEFFDYKNRLMEDLLTDEEIVSLINDRIAFDDAKSLAYTQVFPCDYIPDTVETGNTFVLFDVDIQKSLESTFFIPTIYIWVIVHKSKLRLPEGGIRSDKLCSKIAGAINGSMHYGLGELSLDSVKRYTPMTDYQGKLMIFDTKDFNRTHIPNKSIPSNRKRG